MTPEAKLARVFTALAESSDEESDAVAAGILAIVAEGGVRDLESFNALVAAAYLENGWTDPTRRTAGAAKLKPVPAKVLRYDVAIRRAFLSDIDVAAMKTFYDLRKAAETFSVNLAAANDINRSLIYDVGAVYASLPKQHQPLFELQLKRLVELYVPLARGA
jgi:hypothetical protein